jgi:hypothetical protein
MRRSAAGEMKILPQFGELRQAVRRGNGLEWLAVALALSCSESPTDDRPAEPVNDLVPTHALSDPSPWTYLGFANGRYPGGETVPPAHRAAGLARAQAIRPLDAAGSPSSSGKIVMISIGMSNTTQEFCNPQGNGQCTTGTFVQQALADPAVQRASLVLVDGAAGGQSAGTWTSPDAANYDRVRDTRLAPAGVTERQVQVAWVKVANPQPTVHLPAANADAYLLVNQIGSILRALRIRYPNIQLAFLSNRTYGGYATTALNPEPYAYESGFAVKWVIEAQINQMATGTADPRAGNLSYPGVAPWIGWGPDLWTNGTTPRPDGLVWNREDAREDGTHPSPSGVQKVGRLLLDFFKQSGFARCWFLTSGSCA